MNNKLNNAKEKLGFLLPLSIIPLPKSVWLYPTCRIKNSSREMFFYFKDNSYGAETEKFCRVPNILRNEGGESPKGR